MYALYLIIQMLNDDCSEIRLIGVKTCRLYMDDKFTGKVELKYSVITIWIIIPFFGCIAGDNPLYIQNKFLKFLLKQNYGIIIYFFAMAITMNNQEGNLDNTEIIEVFFQNA